MGASFAIESLIVAKRAAVDVEANRLVKLTATEGDVTPTTAITEDVFAVTIEKGFAGRAVSMETGNGAQARATAGGAIAIGAQVMPMAGGAGKVVTVAGTTALSCGTAVTAAGADGETLVIRFNPGVKSPVNT